MKLNEIYEDITIKTIAKNCQPWINAINGINNICKYTLFRGINIGSRFPKDVEILQPPTDRKPVSIKKSIHTEIDNYFYERYKWHPRSNGVFTIGDYSVAKSYGEVSVLIPIGTFKSLWSPDVDDMLLHAQPPPHFHSVKR